jgi:hypothetical protein
MPSAGRTIHRKKRRSRLAPSAGIRLAGLREAAFGADAIAETRERLADARLRVGGRIVLVDPRELALEGAAQRPRQTLHAARTDDELREILAAEDAMLEAGEARGERDGIVGDARGSRSDAIEELGELHANGLHVAEGAAGRYQRDDLAVLPRALTMHELHRIVRATRLQILARAHQIERCLDGGVSLRGPCITLGSGRWNALLRDVHGDCSSSSSGISTGALPRFFSAFSRAAFALA